MGSPPLAVLAAAILAAAAEGALAEPPGPLGPSAGPPAIEIPSSLPVREPHAWECNLPADSTPGPAARPSGDGSVEAFAEAGADAEDGAFDISRHMGKRFGAFPLVVPITEPAVGYGAIVAPIFVRQDPGGGRPDIYGAGAFATDNGSEGYFAGYSGY